MELVLAVMRGIPEELVSKSLEGCLMVLTHQNPHTRLQGLTRCPQLTTKGSGKDDSEEGIVTVGG